MYDEYVSDELEKEAERRDHEPAIKKLSRWLGDYDTVEVEYDPFGVAWISNGLDDIEIQMSKVKKSKEEKVIYGLRKKIESFESDDVPETVKFDTVDGEVYEANFKDEVCIIRRV